MLNFQILFRIFSKKKPKFKGKFPKIENPMKEAMKYNGKFRGNGFWNKMKENFGIGFKEFAWIVGHDKVMRFANKEYGIMPFLFDSEKMDEFFASFKPKSKESRQVFRDLTNLDVSRKNDNIFFQKKHLQSLVKYLFPILDLYSNFVKEHYSLELTFSKEISKITDFRQPHTWFPEARNIQRTIIYHYGPTNSGKTYNAMESLMNAESGIYCAPLRLLAWENYENMRKKGIKCSLITGQEKIFTEDATHLSCTIECADLQNNYEVAIIDEIQMISDYDRGYAWTNAFFGLRAEKIHLCGDERSLYLIKKFCLKTNDIFEKTEYTRLSKLEIEKPSFNIKTDLKEGDCLISFNVASLHKLKTKINSLYASSPNENLCSIIYGKLPPETRIQQAISFNSRKDVKFLVATDAIGMGLNLRINRIIFTSLQKNQKNNLVSLDNYSIRQISGRAGRFKTNGKVNCMNPKDKWSLREALTEGIPKRKFGKDFQRENKKDFHKEFEKKSQIKKGGLFPMYEQFEKFHSYYKLTFGSKEKVSVVFRKFVAICLLERNYFLSDFSSFYTLLDSLEPVSLSMEDQYIFALAPVSLGKNKSETLTCFLHFATDFKDFNNVSIPEQWFFTPEEEYFEQTSNIHWLEHLYHGFLFFP